MESIEPSRKRQLNSTEPTRRHRLFLFLSLSLNLGLVLFLASAWQRSVQTVPAIPSSDHTIPPNVRIVTTDAKRIAAQAAPASPWAQLESTDLAVYAANLRAAGCPPKTVRDILLPLLQEKFEPPISETTNFWASFSQRQAAKVARAEQATALEQQEYKLLEEVLGFTWTSEGLKQAYGGEAAGSVGFVDYERAEKLLCLADRFKKQFSRADRSHRIDRRLAIYQAWSQEVSEVLAPAEFEETELREILMIYQRRDPNLCKVGLSGPELRQLIGFRRELRNPLPSVFLAEGDELLQEPDWASDQQFNAKARSLLGDSRFLDYLKSCDTSIERTLTVVEKERLPRTLALELFDLRQEAMARAQEIRQQPVRRADKRAQLAALRQSALEQLSALPDAATEGPLLQLNQEWLQEIAHP